MNIKTMVRKLKIPLGEVDFLPLDDEMVGIPIAWPVKVAVAVTVLVAKNESLATCNWVSSTITLPT
jgi:hypothetical protein